jgi:hypothetical protein
MTQLPTFEASPGFTVVFCGPSTSMGEFHPNFVAHEEPFMVFSHALFRSFPAVELLHRIMKECPGSENHTYNESIANSGDDKQVRVWRPRYN